jgi:hypothetical protein
MNSRVRPSSAVLCGVPTGCNLSSSLECVQVCLEVCCTSAASLEFAVCGNGLLVPAIAAASLKIDEGIAAAFLHLLCLPTSCLLSFAMVELLTAVSSRPDPASSSIATSFF